MSGLERDSRLSSSAHGASGPKSRNDAARSDNAQFIENAKPVRFLRTKRNFRPNAAWRCMTANACAASPTDG